jgi:uncharacterized protein (DUF433 family)
MVSTNLGDCLAMEEHTITDRIVQDPTILVGKPVVKGTRIAVEVVLDFLAHNPNFDDLFADYPRLTMDDVRACLAYAQALVHATPRKEVAPTTG